MRRQFLSSLSKQRKFRFAVFDIETENWTKFKVMGFFDGETYREFYDRREFLEFILTHKYRTYKIFAHAGGSFDFQFILETMDKYFPHLSYRILSNNGIGSLTVSNGKDNWYFMDSYKLLTHSLDKLTQAFKVAHPKLKYDFSKMKIGQELSQYLENDCRGLYECLQAFGEWFSAYKVSLKGTIASQSMAFFRQTLRHPIPNLIPEEEEFVRKSYYGGRTEIFKMFSDKKTHCYDVNSMYPYVMKKYRMPIGIPYKVKRFHEDEVGFYHVKVTTPKDIYAPLLPYRLPNKVIFPVGSFEGCYSGVELRKALELGYEIEFLGGYVFPSDFIFDKFIDTLYPKKQSAEEAERIIVKLLLNSLYGKFAQNRDKKTLFKTPPDMIPLGMTVYNEEHGLFEKHSLSRATFIIPSISSMVTSAARVELYEIMERAGFSHVFYSDTDSVFTTSSLPSGSKLGELKLEYDADKVVFVTPKMYAAQLTDGTILKAKGFDSEFRKSLKFEDFWNALNGDYSSFQQKVFRFARAKEALKRTGNWVSMIEKTKSIKSPYDKRIVLENYDTEPIRVTSQSHPVSPSITG